MAWLVTPADETLFTVRAFECQALSTDSLNTSSDERLGCPAAIPGSTLKRRRPLLHLKVGDLELQRPRVLPNDADRLRVEA